MQLLPYKYPGSLLLNISLLFTPIIHLRYLSDLQRFHFSLLPSLNFYFIPLPRIPSIPNYQKAKFSSPNFFQTFFSIPYIFPITATALTTLSLMWAFCPPLLCNIYSTYLIFFTSFITLPFHLHVTFFILLSFSVLNLIIFDFSTFTVNPFSPILPLYPLCLLHLPLSKTYRPHNSMYKLLFFNFTLLQLLLGTQVFVLFDWT